MIDITDDATKASVKQIAMLTELASFDNGATTSQLIHMFTRSVVTTSHYSGFIEKVGSHGIGNVKNKWQVSEKGYRALSMVDKLYDRAVELGL